MTSDESEMAWWRIMWATENAKFKGRGHNVSGSSIGIGKKITHQNTCGHGYKPKGKFHLLDYSNQSNIKSPSEHEFGGMSNYGAYNRGSLMGASPSELQFRNYEDRQKRWSKN